MPRGQEKLKDEDATTYTFTSRSRQATRSRLTTGSSLPFLTGWTRGALDTSGALENKMKMMEANVYGSKNQNGSEILNASQADIEMVTYRFSFSTGISFASRSTMVTLKMLRDIK